MKTFDSVINDYEDRIKRVKACYKYDDKDLGDGIIQGLEDAVEDLKILKEKYEPSKIKYNIENAKEDIWKLREEANDIRYPIERDEVIRRMIDLLYSLADVVSRKDK